MIRRATPPVAPAGFDLRTWLAGCALANPNLITSRDPATATSQALEYADGVIRSLSSKVTPPTNVEAPTAEQMADMDKRQAEKNSRRALAKITKPDIRVKRCAAESPTVIDVASSSRPGRYSLTRSEVPE